MSLVPKKKPEKVAYFLSKVAPWTANAVAIGTTSATVTAFSALVTAAQSALADQDAAWGAYRAKVEAADLACDGLGDAGADIISQVRLKARTAGDIVFTLAEIPAPATPSPVGPPGKPSAFNVKLFPNGSLELTFKCGNPAGSHGTLYNIYRKIESTDSYEFLGGAGEKKFTDNTVPAGVPSVMYQVQAVRTTAIGIAAEFTVNFGTTAGGATVATVATPSGKPAKIAA